MARNSIQKKLLRGTMGILLPAFLVTIAVVVVLSVNQASENRAASERSIRGALQAKGRLLVLNNGQALSGMVADNAILSIQSIVAQTVQDDDDVIYGVFMTNARQAWVIADSSKPDGSVDGQVILEDTTAMWAAGLEKLGFQMFTKKDGSEFMEFAVPVKVDDEVAGWLRYGLTMDNLRKTLEESRIKARNDLTWLIFILAILAVVALLVAYVMARRQSATFSKPIQDLNAAANVIAEGNYQQSVEIESDDEVGDLAKSFEHMRQTVKNYTEHLEDLVNEKMRQVRDILDNIDQGLFTVNLDGTINDEYSRSTNKILGVENVASGTIDAALHLDDEQMLAWNDWVELVRARHKAMRWDKLVKLAPVLEFEVMSADEPRTVKVSYQPVFDGKGELCRIMTLALDITESRKIERIIAEEKLRHENEVKTILGLVNTLPEVVQDFFADTDTRIGLIEKNLGNLKDECEKLRNANGDNEMLCTDQNTVSAIFRDLHTIKGNSATYGFETLSAVAHEAENVLESLRPPVKVNTADTIQELYKHIELLKEERQGIDGVSRRLRGGDQLMVHIAESKLKYLDSLAQKLAKEESFAHSTAIAPLLEACMCLRHVPLLKLVDKYRSMVERLSEKLEKKVAFQCIPESFELPPSFFKPLNEAMVHILRNAVDHGIESPEERLQKQKEMAGTIRVQVEAMDTSYIVKVVDDGKGVDTESLTRKAIALGLKTEAECAKMSHQEKLSLLFMSGITTKTEASDVSGRGVGMDSVFKGLESIGASIQIQSELGFGSAFIIELPHSAFQSEDT